MSYSELLETGRIKAEKFSRKQIKDCLDLATRDISTARKIVKDDTDWGYNIAYNGMLQAARALMLSKGFRATGEWQHLTTIQFAMKTLGPNFVPDLELMDRMRRKRHRAVYEIAGVVSSKEANEAIKTAERFVRAISEIID